MDHYMPYKRCMYNSLFTTMTEEKNTDKKVNPFVTDLWKAEYCDPSNWAYKPSTYGIEGAYLVGEPEMMLFSEMTGHWLNPGRKLRINEYKLREMKEYMLEHGIDTDKGEFGYVDADTDAAVVGIPCGVLTASGGKVGLGSGRGHGRWFGPTLS